MVVMQGCLAYLDEFAQMAPGHEWLDATGGTSLDG